MWDFFPPSMTLWDCGIFVETIKRVSELARFLTLATDPSDHVPFWGLQNDHFGTFKIDCFWKILFLVLQKCMFFQLFVKIIQF